MQKFLDYPGFLAMSFAFRYFHPNPGWTASPQVPSFPVAPAAFQQSTHKQNSHKQNTGNAADQQGETFADPRANSTDAYSTDAHSSDKSSSESSLKSSDDGTATIVSSPLEKGFLSGPSTPITDTVGKHCILELYDCDCARLDDEQVVRAAITNAALRAGATLLNLISHRFEPHGVTALALLAESHISIHSWPESGYAAVDVFTCGDHTMPESACRVLVEEFGARHHSLRSFRRETPGMLAGLHREPVAGAGVLSTSAGQA